VRWRAVGDKRDVDRPIFFSSIEIRSVELDRDVERLGMILNSGRIEQQFGHCSNGGRFRRVKSSTWPMGQGFELYPTSASPLVSG